MLTKELAYGAAPSDARRLASKVLRSASRVLARLAREMVRRPDRPVGEAVYEFYAESGAPEGALYIDGRLVGHIEGVKRL